MKNSPSWNNTKRRRGRVKLGKTAALFTANRFSEIVGKISGEFSEIVVRQAKGSLGTNHFRRRHVCLEASHEFEEEEK